LNILSNPTWLITWIAGLLIVPTFYVIAFQVIIADITLALLGGFMPLFLAFLPLSFASPVVSGYVRYYLYTLFKLFFIYILLIPVINLPGLVIATTSTDTLTQTNPIDGCENPLVSNPDAFSVENTKPETTNKFSRADLSISLAALALAGAALLKTIPERLASQVTSRFTLAPLYDIHD
jgi:TrbL/VirB6 plasmid conjugal transfer protein.